MLSAILYFAAAGAALVGGPTAGTVLLRRGQQKAAEYLQEQDASSVGRVLRIHIDLAKLREEARAAGVDPDLVEQAYREMRDGLITPEQLAARLRELGQG